ncbi:MAG TPA: hypothetical protein VGF30_02470 [Bacteroidia bacterium]
MSKTIRACVYPKDVMRITGKSERYARKFLNTIKRHFEKADHQFITVSEFSDYTGIEVSTIEKYLID